MNIILAFFVLFFPFNSPFCFSAQLPSEVVDETRMTYEHPASSIAIWTSATLEDAVENTTARSSLGETPHTHTYICKNSAVSVDERKGRSNPDGANAVGLHLWLIMSNTLEASPPQLLPRHKSHTSGPLIPRCWTLVAGKRTHKHTQSPYVYTLKFMQSFTNSFIKAYSDLFLSVWLPKYTM